MPDPGKVSDPDMPVIDRACSHTTIFRHEFSLAETRSDFAAVPRQSFTWAYSRPQDLSEPLEIIEKVFDPETQKATVANFSVICTPERGLPVG